MTIEELGGCFVILCIGGAAAIMIFVMEEISFHFIAMKRQFSPAIEESDSHVSNIQFF